MEESGMAYAFELWLFGQGEGRVEGVPFPRLRARAGWNLLALLTLHSHQPLERSWLAATLWPDSSEAQALYNLRRNLVDLRRALGEQEWRLASPTPRTLCLDFRNAFCDVHAFDSLLHDNLPATKERWEAAVSLYCGPLLEGCTDAWVLAERAAREQDYLAALEALADKATREALSAEAARYLRRVVAVDPYRETAQRALMLTLAEGGNLAGAMLAYRKFRLLLQSIRSEPASETLELYHTLRNRVSTGAAPLLPAQKRNHNPGDVNTRPEPGNAALPSNIEFTPSAAASHNLPYPLNSLIGRIGERRDVQAALQTARIITLTGPGGVGKTRLALAVAEEAVGDFPDGVWFADLAPVQDGSAVAQAVTSALGLHPDTDTTPEATLCRFFGQNRALLILDNGEQIAEACARFAVHLLRACPLLRILCTSRQPLYVPGENVWVVSPLRIPPAPAPTDNAEAYAADLTNYEAAALLLARALEAKPAFRLSPQNAPAVAQLCRQLEGLPLALELAAARFRSLPVLEIAQRLDSRFRLLASGNSTAPRHRTLQATLDWSYDLLNKAERRLLRCLTVFAGGWTLEAAEAVCAEEEEERGKGQNVSEPYSRRDSHFDVPILLASLVDKSLVVYEETEERGRYRLLEMTREYAAERLSPEERLSLQKRHADFFFRYMDWLVETNRTEHQVDDWLKRLWIERDNFRAAHTWYLERDTETALRLEFSLYSTRVWPVQNAREWIERLQQQSMPPTVVGALVSYSVASWALWLGNPASEQLLKQALEVACACGDNPLQMHTLALLTSLEEERGNKRQALEYAEATLDCAKQSGDEHNVSEYGAKAALHLWYLGDAETAQQRLQTMLREGRQGGDWHLLYYSLWGLGEIAMEQGDYAQVRACCQQIMPLAERYLPFTQANLWRSQSLAACRQQDYPAAWRCLEQALAVSRQTHAYDREGWTRFDMAELAFQQGDATGAREHFRHCISIFDSIHELRSVARCLHKLAAFCTAWEQTAYAVTLLASVERAFREQEFTTTSDEQNAAGELAADLRGKMDQADWQAAWQHGSELTLAQATAYAFSALMPSPSSK